MIILATDTSTSVCSVALARKTDHIDLIARVSIDRPNAHSEKIIQLIDWLFSETDISRNSIDALAVTIGPGSFTGLRIGLSVTKGLGFSMDRPIVGVPTLQVIADKMSFLSNTIWVALTSRKNEFYSCAFKGGNNISGNKLFTHNQLSNALESNDILISDDPAAFWTNSDDKYISILDKYYAIPDSFHLSRLAFERAEGNHYDVADSLVPDYWQGFRSHV